MDIRVREADWGDANRQDIERLLEDVATHIARLLRDPLIGSIVVEPSPPTKDYPETLPRSSPEEPYTILLSARGKLWAQFSYQFAHEFCHVLSGYESMRKNPNNWFVEALCELASIFTLRRMVERWPTQPPYQNWASYGASLARYTIRAPVTTGHAALLSDAIKQLLSCEQDNLRKTSLRTEFGEFSKSDRDKVAVISHALLPLFENEPTGWNAVRKVPVTNGPLTEYLADWYAQAELTDKPFLKRILDVFELTP